MVKELASRSNGAILMGSNPISRIFRSFPKTCKNRMVVYDFVTPENLAVKYPEDGLFIDGSILFKTDPDQYEVNTSFTITLDGQTITKDAESNIYTLAPSGIVIRLQDDGLLEITGQSLRISESIDGAMLSIISEINEYLTRFTSPVKGGKKSLRKKSRKLTKTP